jgi:hypothetical protein
MILDIQDLFQSRITIFTMSASSAMMKLVDDLGLSMSHDLKNGEEHDIIQEVIDFQIQLKENGKK